MRQFTTILLLIFGFMGALIPPAFCSIKGGVNYSIPIYYENIDESELQEQGKIHFFNAMQLPDGEVEEETTKALNAYRILQNVNPNNIDYSVKAGRLYDKIGKDRYAKGNFSRAIGINPSNPEPYFYLGEFYYKRELYRRALKYYKEAYSKGYQTNYDLLFRLGDIYEKFGDTNSALKYLKEAEIQSPNPELSSKIQRIESIDNSEYYRRKRTEYAE